MTTQPLCICGFGTIAVLLVSVAVALVYAELIARDAVRRALADQARHRTRAESVTVDELRERTGSAPTCLNVLPYHPDDDHDRW